MIFYYKKPTEKDFKEVRDFLSLFDVKVHFVRKGYSSAYKDKLIEIDRRETSTIRSLWSIVFHELGHIYCYRHKLYKRYHHDYSGSKNFNKYIHRYGLRAERFVDKVGKKLMKTYLPDISYLAGYLTQKDVEWYNKWLRRYFPL